MVFDTFRLFVLAARGGIFQAGVFRGGDGEVVDFPFKIFPLDDFVDYVRFGGRGGGGVSRFGGWFAVGVVFIAGVVIDEAAREVRYRRVFYGG